MKIMFNAYNLGKGGAERVISILSNSFIKKNIVEIIINDKSKTEYEIDSEVKIFELDTKKIKNKLLRNIYREKETEKILNNEKPDIIISFLPAPSFRVLIANRKLKIPVIVSDRNNPKKEYSPLIKKILMKILYKKADAFVFQTKEQSEYFCRDIQKKSKIIYNPLKEEFIENSQRKNPQKTIVAVGRLVPQKNHKILIKAFDEVVKKHDDYNLKIFGKGKLEKRLKKYIKRLGLEDKVLLCGVKDDIKPELEKAEIFVLSSNFEGLPNSLIEAMAIGLPAIATDCPCGGPREIIKDGKNGLLVPVKNSTKMAEAINRLIEDKQLRSEISFEATKIKNELNPNKITNEWQEYMELVLKKGGKNE